MQKKIEEREAKEQERNALLELKRKQDLRANEAHRKEKMERINKNQQVAKEYEEEQKANLLMKQHQHEKSFERVLSEKSFERDQKQKLFVFDEIDEKENELLLLPLLGISPFENTNENLNLRSFLDSSSYEKMVGEGMDFLLRDIEKRLGIERACKETPPQVRLHNPLMQGYLQYIDDHVDWDAKALVGYTKGNYANLTVVTKVDEEKEKEAFYIDKDEETKAEDKKSDDASKNKSEKTDESEDSGDKDKKQMSKEKGTKSKLKDYSDKIEAKKEEMKDKIKKAVDATKSKSKKADKTKDKSDETDKDEVSKEKHASSKKEPKKEKEDSDKSDNSKIREIVTKKEEGILEVKWSTWKENTEPSTTPISVPKEEYTDDSFAASCGIEDPNEEWSVEGSFSLTDDDWKDEQSVAGDDRQDDFVKSLNLDRYCGSVV